MSCFWDTIIQNLPPEMMHRPPTPRELMVFFKERNGPTPHVHWQGQPLTAQQQRENQQWVAEEPVTPHAGHLTSICDPFLCLLCEMLRSDIRNDYNGTPIQYTFVPCAGTCCSAVPQLPGLGRAMRMRNDRGHMWKS